jgi:multiple sugar transport system substrate-binding protein
MFKYEVMPTPAAVESMASQSGYGGTNLQVVGGGDILASPWGRYSFIQLRRFESFKPDVALLPYKVMPMQRVSARGAGITACSENPELAARFLQYLAEERYNRQIVKDADALPPNPEAAKWETFTAPPEHPEEGPANVKYYRAAAEYGVGTEYSLYVNPFTVKRIIDNYLSGLDSQAIDIDTALRRMQSDINNRIDNTLREDKQLRKQYEKAMKQQEKINQLKKQGKEIPLEWIENPVIRRLAESGKWPVEEKK